MKKKPITKQRRLKQWRKRKEPVLRFTPYAWSKLLWFRDRGDTEIGGFAICNANDLLLVEDFVTCTQSTSAVTVGFDDESVADFFEQQVDAGLEPRQFLRIWCHTHPGDSADPSGTDEETFDRVFGQCDWAVMFILARGGETYSRLRFNTGPGSDVLIPVQIEYGAEFAGSDPESWQVEYDMNIQAIDSAFSTMANPVFDELDPYWLDHYDIDEDALEQLELLGYDTGGVP